MTLRCFSICPFAYPSPYTTGSLSKDIEGPFPYVRYDCVTVCVNVYVYFGSLHDPIGTTKRTKTDGRMVLWKFPVLLHRVFHVFQSQLGTKI